MADIKLISEEEARAYWEGSVRSLPTSTPNINIPNENLEAIKDELVKERKSQRGKLINFVCYLTIASFYLLAGIVIVQMFMRVSGDANIEIMDAGALKVLAVSVFGQVVGLMYVMAKSLWDGKEFNLFNK